MSGNFVKKVLCILVAAALLIQPPGFAVPGFGVMSMADTFEARVSVDRLNVRSGPGTGYPSLSTLSTSTTVLVTGETRGTDGNLWYSITIGNVSGYVRSDLLKKKQVYSVNDMSFEQWLNTQGFPESYKNGLRGLHEQYPNWVFEAQHTGLEWEDVIAEESRIGRNLVHQDSKSSWKSTEPGAFDWSTNTWPGFDGAVWQAASSGIIRYYMDPRNFLDDPGVFQFLLQSYDTSLQTREGLLSMVSGTFLEGSAPVPVNGSVIVGGTPCTGDVPLSAGSWTANSTYSSPRAVGSAGIGPGGSVSSDSTSAGADNKTSFPGTSSSGPGDSSAGPGEGAAVISEAPALPGLAGGVFRSGLMKGLFRLTGGFLSYADWKQENGTWYYTDTDGSLRRNGWYWIDGNRDGISECYYFDSEGRMASDTLVEGYTVNADGQWTENGIVRTKGSLTGSTSSASVDLSGYTWKYVPYTDLIMKGAELSGVSPYVLAAMILQEQGTEGKSDSISGADKKYPGVYNFYNLGAYAHDNMGAVEAGLKYASEEGNGDRPWNNIEKAIIGGAKAYGANYVSVGQNTFYLKKFNVQGSNMYNHQYMTNVPAAAAEAVKSAKAYTAEVRRSSLVFKIPVFRNMPETACPMPTGDGNPNNKLSSLSVEGYVLTPTFRMDTCDYSLIVDENVTEVTVKASAADKGASVSNVGRVGLNQGVNNLTIQVTAANGTTRDYRLSITRKGDLLGSITNVSSDQPSAGPGDAAAGTVNADGVSGRNENGILNYGPGSASFTDNSGNGPGGFPGEGSEVLIVDAPG